MSNTRKRTFKDINMNDMNSNPNKKRKVSKTEINSKLFLDKVDQNQFKMIYNSITNCDNINHIPSSIIYEISEYATGIITKCDNYEKCENEIAWLNHDKNQKNSQRDFYYFNPNEINVNKDKASMDSEDDDHQWIFNDIFKDSNHKIQLFCSDCSKTLRQCTFMDKISSEERYFCSGRYINDNDLSKCDCDQQTKMCKQHRYKCEECNVQMCQPPEIHIKYECQYHRREYCYLCNTEGIATRTRIYTKSICMQKGKRCELCDEFICDEHIIDNEWCDCDDDHSKWTHNQCSSGCVITSELEMCVKCMDMTCSRCLYNEPMEYECLTCSGDYKYQTFCVDCIWDVKEEVLCEQCGHELICISIEEDEETQQKDKQ
eukprot:143973_1